MAIMAVRLIRNAAKAALIGATLLGASAAQAQVAPLQYWIPGGPFGFGSGAPDSDASGWSAVPGFAAGESGRGIVFRSFETPVSPFASGLSWSGLGAFGNTGALNAQGAQYGYAFRGVGDMPVTLFGGVSSLRSAPDTFSNLVTPGVDSGETLATSFNAGIEFRPTSNISLSLSGSFVQPSAGNFDSDIRSPLLPGQSPMFLGGRR